MKRIELQIEHTYKNRFVGRHRIGAGQGLTTLGSSRDADIRLLGENVSGIHATLEWQDNQWVLSDVGSEHGTWVQKKPVIHHEINEAIFVSIGQHQIKLTPITQQHDLFNTEATESLDKPGQLFQQVVVRRHGVLVENSLMAPHESYEIVVAGERMRLSAPTSEQWIVREDGPVEIRQRLVKSNLLERDGRADIAAFVKDPSLRAPLILAVSLFVVFASISFFLPQEPKDPMVALQPQEQNRFTRMIYDAKKIKKEMAESQKLRKQVIAKIDEKHQPTQGAMQAKSLPGGGGTKVVNNIKSSGLSALIGKISARAAKSAVLIQSAGVAPDVQGSGVALGIGATIGARAPAQTGLSAGEGHKIGAIGTAGKGGGSSDYKGFGGMAVGNVGNALVGVVEEETEVDGGLDKDVIARYIKSQLGQIRYCYERQLSASPDLYGKVMVKFTIGDSGSVTTQNIGTTSLNNAMVEGCILRRIAGWRFPAPKGGTQVVVSYPFLFKSTR